MKKSTRKALKSIGELLVKSAPFIYAIAELVRAVNGK